MIKVSLFQGSEEYGPAAVPLFGAADSYFEKVASASLLPEVSTYIAQLQPRNDSQYVLVNAMGAGEYYGSNVNGDRFSEEALIHSPNDWKGIPVYDKVKSADWAYGFPTFYGAHVFPHHRNKDAKRALGFVELAAWNPHMKRVELVTRLDNALCLKFGGEGIWDKLKAGMFPDVSMGTKVPFDTCSITLDKELYYKAWATYDPKKHKSPGEAILEYHKKLKAKDGVGIRGVSITRADYSKYARTRMNFILPDGRKVWVDNDFPKFFDLSYVFMGADRIAKAMLKIADAGRVYYFMGSAELAEKLGMSDDDDVQEKTAASKQATPKSAEMNKEVIPNQLAGKAVPLLTANEPDLPQDVLGAMGAAGLDSALTTSAGLGMVLRPREFQRITLICLGKRDVADQLDALGQVFPKVEERDPLPMEGSSFSPGLASILAPLLGDRSAFGPVIERRVVVVAGTTPKDTKKDTSHSSELLRKIGAAYNGYRDSLMQFVPEAQDLIEASTSPSDATLRKLAGVPAEELFTPLSVQYLTHAFLDELGTPDQEVVKHAHASVQRVLPLATTQHQQRVGVLQS
jgi:hypothetical protein